MGNRLTKIYTRTGDDGCTGMADGSRIDKDALRIEAIGALDELNCALGMLLNCEGIRPLAEMLINVQHDLFDLGAELSMPGHVVLKDERVPALEQALDAVNENLPPLKEFILPGGGVAAAQCQVARAVCRRAERRLISLQKKETLRPVMIHYLNRLSDLLFVYARWLAREAGEGEVFWRSQRLSK